MKRRCRPAYDGAFSDGIVIDTGAGMPGGRLLAGHMSEPAGQDDWNNTKDGGRTWMYF
ncbi:hypothetical protein SAMN04489742_3696 [Arthrobacter crystallopoietes]|uniref:Uncharacterized protein n=1 Tax=Crystallibacter crystallopoietes TaxID=37928 RepID=A0A1H1FWN1_9MICC|nr:hypothetical protein SAMN04489742_3696 [Arthrobacter crystallopoietes]